MPPGPQLGGCPGDPGGHEDEEEGDSTQAAAVRTPDEGRAQPRTDLAPPADGGARRFGHGGPRSAGYFPGEPGGGAADDNCTSWVCSPGVTVYFRSDVSAFE